MRATFRFAARTTAVLVLLGLSSGADELSLAKLRLAGMTTGWGSARANRSVDGNALRIGGKTFESGVGTHAASLMLVQRNGAVRFQASVGVDDEVGELGSVVFSVLGDDKELWTSGVMKGGQAAKPVDVELGTCEQVKLMVADAGDGIGHDHADWADARFVFTGKAPAAVVVKKPWDLPDADAQVPTAPVELFNGKDIDNWHADLPRGGTKEAVWTVKDGVLYCAGKPGGHLVTDTAWKNYRLVIEWRWPPGGRAGNNGALVHTSDLRVLGNMFPRSIEVQLQSGNAGDFWVIGEDIEVPNMAKRRRGRHIRNLTDGSEQPIGEWNRMVIHAKDDTLTVWVNDQLVNEGHSCSVSEGRVTLQSEGAPCQFRRVSVMPLP